MKKISVTEYLKQKAEKSEKPFLASPSVLDGVIPEFMRTDDFQNIITAVMEQLYGEYLLLDKYQYGDYLNTVPMSCNSLYALNAFKYENLFKSTQLEFDPIENYNMVEESTEKQTGHAENTMDYGKETQTTQYGEQNSTQTYGQQNTTHSVSPDNTARFVPERQDAMSERADKSNITQHTDTSTRGGYTDIASGDDSRDITRTLTRKGNIGVTSSVQLAEQYRSYANFSLYRIVAQDIMCQICKRFLSVSELVDY